MNIFCLIPVFLVFCLGATVESHFTLIGPVTVQYKSIYKCVLSTTYRERDNASVEIAFVGKTSANIVYGEVYNLDKEFQNKTIVVDLSKHEPVENFTLNAVLKVKNEVLHNQTVNIFVISKRYFVFVQTDKPVYKPGDEVLYRIIVLDSDLKPYDVEDGNLIHAVYDVLGNLLPEGKAAEPGEEQEISAPSNEPTITNDDFGEGESNPASPENDAFPDDQAPKKRKSVLIDKDKGKITNGVYSYSYQLSDEPIEGIWSINVTIDNEYQFATIQPFQVRRYMLPGFEVFVDTKHHVNRDEGDILLNVYANYSTGLYVKGKAKVKASVFDIHHPDWVQVEVIKEIQVEIKTTVSFNVESDLKITNAIRPFQVKFEVEFEEAVTGQVMFATTTVKVHKYKDYQIKIVREQKKFKPGFPCAFEVQVKQADGNPVEPSNDSLKLSVEFHFKPVLGTPVTDSDYVMKKLDYMEQKLLVKGVARFKLDIPENTTAFTIKAQYFDSSVVANVSRYKSGSREYLTIEHVKKRNGQFILPEKVGEPFKIKATFTKGVNVTDLFYIVMNQHGIVAERRFSPQIIDDKVMISIAATEQMMPTCNLIVYYIHPGGEIIYDQMKVFIPRSSLSMMALKFENDHETKLPGQSVQLLTKAPVGSFVFLLGVDESAELLGEGNDIDIPRVLAGLKPFRSSKFIQGEAEVEFQGFSESNAIIMTNAFGLERDFNLVDRRWCNNDFKRDDSPPEGFRDDDEDESSPEIPELKKLTVPETWIFKDF